MTCQGLFFSSPAGFSFHSWFSVSPLELVPNLKPGRKIFASYHYMLSVWDCPLPCPAFGTLPCTDPSRLPPSLSLSFPPHA